MKQIIKIIKKSKNVAVFGHQSPDGDCLGCISAISFLCKKLNKNVHCFIDDDIAKRYKFLDFSEINKNVFSKNQYDLLISVDVANSKLLGKYANTFKNHNNTIVIDHHYGRDLVGKNNLINSDMASCSEIMYELIKVAKQKIDKETATKIYLGVAGDTGCFVHDNTTSNSHKVASELIELNADYKLVNLKVFKQVSLKIFEIKNILNSKIQCIDNIRFVVINIDFLKEHSFTKRDLGDYVNTITNIENTKIAFILTEKQKNVFSLSLRCVKEYDVSKVAKKFNGNGHKQSAGGEIRGNIENCLKKVIDECKKAIILGDSNVW